MKRSRIAALLTVCATVGSMSMTSLAMAEVITVGGTTSVYNTAIANGQNTPQVTLTPGTVTKTWSTSENNTIEVIDDGTLNVEGYDAPTGTIINGILGAQGGSVNLTGGNLTIGSGSAIADAVALTIDSNAVLNITGGTVNLNGDTILGSINAQAGILNIDADTNIGKNLINNGISINNNYNVIADKLENNSGTFNNYNNVKIKELNNYSNGNFSNNVTKDSDGNIISYSTLEATTINNEVIGESGENDYIFTNDGDIIALDNSGLVINNAGVFENNETGRIFANIINNESGGGFINEGKVDLTELLKNEFDLICAMDIFSMVLV